MGRKIVTRLELFFDEDLLYEGTDSTDKRSDEDVLEYAAECFVDDVFQMVKYNELFAIAKERTYFVESNEEDAAAEPGNNNV
jgi:hypothetical protein